MMSRVAYKAIVIAGLFFCAISAPRAALAAGADTLKAEIDAFIERLSTNDVVHWEGADSIDVRDDGADAVATISKGKISFDQLSAKPPSVPATLTFDRIEIRRSPKAGGDERVQFTVKLPALSRMVVPDGSDVTLALKDASLTALVEGPAEHQRDVALSVASGRLEHQTSASWLNFGPLTSHWKIIRSDSGGWTAPLDFETKSIEFALPAASLTGGVEHVVYAGSAAGPSLTELDALRDQMAEVNKETDPNKKLATLLPLLPKIFTEFAYSKGELTIEQLTVKKPDIPNLLSLTKATFGGSLTGFDTDKATIRLTFGHEGLTIDPSLLPAERVPHRAVIDVGLEEISVSTLRALADAASRMGPGASDEDKQQALPQAIAAAMSLAPVLRIDDAAVDFRDVAIDATGEAKRAPPAPIGYTASGDVVVRGFDALPEIVTDKNGRNLLALLKFIGDAGTGADGAKTMKFHWMSATGKPITVNGSDISGWFAGAGQSGRMPGSRPRALRLADPPEEGDDVRAVQKAVKANEVEAFSDGTYDVATALAVARFQKAAGLNVSGVVDPPTAEKLGLKPSPAPSPSKN
jgi:hypothetical protein